VIVLAGASAASAQSTSVLVGTVVDSTGGVVPGATLTVTQVDTGVARTTVSDETGAFRMPALAPGQYARAPSSKASGPST
jgi:protocatechuate 3,4-dioxygenase beta subunit